MAEQSAFALMYRAYIFTRRDAGSPVATATCPTRFARMAAATGAAPAAPRTVSVGFGPTLFWEQAADAAHASAAARNEIFMMRSFGSRAVRLAEGDPWLCDPRLLR